MIKRIYNHFKKEDGNILRGCLWYFVILYAIFLIFGTIMAYSTGSINSGVIFFWVIFLIILAVLIIPRIINKNEMRQESNEFNKKYSDYLDGDGNNDVKNDSKSTKYEIENIKKDENNMWKCKNCGEYIESDFEVCWNCQTKKKGD